jgi:glycosyltransferase involved in cell wall biosynthesis
VPIGLCLLTRNEIEGCKHDVGSLPLDQFDAVYCVDGNSTDGTVEYLNGLGIEVITQSIKGYNGAYIEAFDVASQRDIDAVVFFHPKGSIDPAIVTEFKPLLEDGHALVIASRICKGAVNEEDSKLIKPRKWFVMLMGLVLWICFRRRGRITRDVLHGCRAMRTDAFEMANLRTDGVTADLEMVVATYRLKETAAEFPVEERARLAGQTHFKALPTGWRLIKYVMSEILSPKTARSVPLIQSDSVNHTGEQPCRKSA